VCSPTHSVLDLTRQSTEVDPCLFGLGAESARRHAPTPHRTQDRALPTGHAVQMLLRPRQQPEYLFPWPKYLCNRWAKTRDSQLSKVATTRACLRRASDPGFSLPRCISKRSKLQPNHALAGRAGLQDGQPRELPRQAEVGKVWHPIDLPEGYHTPARGQSQTAHAPVPSRAAPELACGRAAPGRQDATRAPTCKIGDHVELMIIWILFGHKTHPDNPRQPPTTSVCSREIRWYPAVSTNNHNNGPRILGFWVRPPGGPPSLQVRELS
jgi:hypothetical protein